jgi:type VI secretion system secreted protein VgrG
MKSKCLILPALVALAGFLPQSKASILLTADSFGVLGASTVTSTGNTVVNGDLGVFPGSEITGFPAGIVNGTTHIPDAVAKQAQIDAFAAFVALRDEPTTLELTGQVLGNGGVVLTLTPGVYFFSSSAQLTGKLILDAQDVPNARFDFLIGSALTTASGSSILLTGGAQANNVFWQVGSSATLGTGTSFNGTILANTSIALNTGANMFGRALALNGAVTLDNNNITVPVPEPTTMIAGALLLLPFGASTLRRMRKTRTA